MQKRLFAAFIALIIMIGLVPRVNATTVPNEISSIGVGTHNVLLYEANTNSVLYEYDSNGQAVAFPASTTKILTAIIVIDMCEGKNLLGDVNEYFDNADWIDPDFSSRTFSLDDEITVTDPETRGSTMGIRHGEVLTVRDLLYGMMLVSGNDCARALAIHFSPGKEYKVAYFADMMNAYAKELGATQSNFEVPHGLHDDAHVSTTKDLALITAYALKNPTFRQIVSTETYTIAATNKRSEFILENTNRLIHTKLDDDASYKYEYAIGVKTGDTGPAGRCIVSAAEKDGMLLIAVLLGNFEDSEIGVPRYENSIKLFEYGFNNFKIVNVSELGIESAESPYIEMGDLKLKVDLDSANACMHVDDIAAITSDIDKVSSAIKYYSGQDTPAAPIQGGDIVGCVEYEYDGKILFKANVVAMNSITNQDSIVLSTDENSTYGEVNPNRNNDADLDAEWSWIIWVLLFCILLIIILVIIAITKQPIRRRNSQLRRRTRR